MQVNRWGPWGMMSRLFNLRLVQNDGNIVEYPVIVSTAYQDCLLFSSSNNPNLLFRNLKCSSAPSCHSQHVIASSYLLDSFLLWPRWTLSKKAKSLAVQATPLLKLTIPQAKQLHRTSTTLALENICFMYCPPYRIVKVNVPIRV